MRIAYFTTVYPRATDTFIQREVGGLRRRGLDICTFAVRSAGADHDVGPDVIEHKRTTQYLLPTGVITVLRANLSMMMTGPIRYVEGLITALRAPRAGWSGILKHVAYFQEAVVLAFELRRQGVQHIHNHFGDVSGTVTLLASRLTAISYSMTIHGPHIFFDPKQWMLPEKVGSSAFIVCIGDYCRSQMMLFSQQRHWDKLKVVRCGVDIDRFKYNPVRQVARKLLYTGRLAAEKGLPVLFHALRALLEGGHDFELTLVGDGVDRDQLKQLAEQLGITDRVKFTGFLGEEDVRFQLQQSDVFILPSFAEGVPVSLMEAMAAGVPVLATYVGGVAELIESGHSGLLVPASNCEALAATLARYLSDYELRHRVSMKAREVIEHRYNREIELDKLTKLFRSIGSTAS